MSGDVLMKLIFFVCVSGLCLQLARFERIVMAH